MRYPVNAPATFSARWDGDPGVTTVRVTRDDGTVLVAAGTATSGSGTGPRTYTLASGLNTKVDRLTVTWTTASLGSKTTYEDIVGGHYVLLADILDAGNVDDQSTSKAEKARFWAETFVDRYCETAFTARYSRFSGYGTGNLTLTLNRPLRAVQWATVDGVTEDFSGWVLEGWGGVVAETIFPSSLRVEVGYEFGHDAAPPDLQEAIVTMCRYYMLESKNRMFDRARSVESPEGGMTFLSTPGPDRPTGLPMVDAVLNSYREHVPTVA